MKDIRKHTDASGYEYFIHTLECKPRRKWYGYFNGNFFGISEDEIFQVQSFLLTLKIENVSAIQHIENV